MNDLQALIQDKDAKVQYAVKMGQELSEMLSNGTSQEVIAAMYTLTRRLDTIAADAVRNVRTAVFAPTPGRYVDAVKWGGQFQVIAMVGDEDQSIYTAQDKGEAREFAHCYEQGAVWA